MRIVEAICREVPQEGGHILVVSIDLSKDGLGTSKLASRLVDMTIDILLIDHKPGDLWGKFERAPAHIAFRKPGMVFSASSDKCRPSFFLLNLNPASSVYMFIFTQPFATFFGSESQSHRSSCILYRCKPSALCLTAKSMMKRTASPQTTLRACAIGVPRLQMMSPLTGESAGLV
ncbi:hypothetical protein CVT25_006659 [Psilocybe cyanescens]|uniref:Uncharacterized protein n=1 Tax=Psilocybe cyanescens TaxID=93625 RepID=A0A409XTU8_PSICY|nr:hypothetical protein CVT25_006659 [Psilocybe cyanescens]